MNVKLTLSVLSFVLFFISCNDSDSTIEHPPLYSKNDLSSNFSVTRDTETSKATVVIEGLTNWKLFVGKNEREINYDKPISEGSVSQVLDMELGNEYYCFQIVSDQGNALASSRLLPISKAYNFRDLGGYKTKDGKYTKWGKMFRSGEINLITDEDINFLASIPLTTIVDFRTQEEIASARDTRIPSVTNEYVMSIEAGNLSVLKQMAGKTEEEIEQMSIDLNLDLVTNPVAQTGFKEYFKVLQNLGDNTILFHCTAGKDRTGIAAALTLYALGVDKTTIIKDYMESNEHLKDKYVAQIAMYPPVIAFFHVREKYMNAAFEQIESDYGSIENYLENVLDVDREALRRNLLY